MKANETKTETIETRLLDNLVQAAGEITCRGLKDDVSRDLYAALLAVLEARSNRRQGIVA